MAPASTPLIVHIIYRLGIGGLENGLVNLINETPAGSYRHAVICLAGYTDFADRIQRDDVAIYDLHKQPGKDIACYFRLYRLLRKLRPQVVHTRNFASLDCQFVALLAGVKVRIHGEHGWEADDLTGTRSNHVSLRRIARMVIKRYVTVSQHMAEWLQTVIGVPAEKVVQIYNGTDTARFAPASVSPADPGPESGRPLVIGIVGRLDPIKDHLSLLQACAELRSRRPDDMAGFRLVIVGDGELRETLDKAVAKLSLGEVVTFAGPSAQVAERLREFDLFVLPSLNEGISNTILEAMATGLPVIATAVGGNPEIVDDGRTGTLVPVSDAGALADSIDKYLRNPDLRRAHGAAGRAAALQRFSLVQMVTHYYKLYDSCLDKHWSRQEHTG